MPDMSVSYIYAIATRDVCSWGWYKVNVQLWDVCSLLWWLSQRGGVCLYVQGLTRGLEVFSDPTRFEVFSELRRVLQAPSQYPPTPLDMATFWRRAGVMKVLQKTPGTREKGEL